jgi:hypothetical protein
LSTNPGSADQQRAKPTSAHPGGFIITMCDGRAQFMNEDVEYRVYAMIMAPDSQNAKNPGSNVPVAYPDAIPWKVVVGQSALTPISEADINK